MRLAAKGAPKAGGACRFSRSSAGGVPALDWRRRNHAGGGSRAHPRAYQSLRQADARPASVDPELATPEGEAVPEILSQIEEDGGSGLFALGTSPDNGGPRPIMTSLSRRLGPLPVPRAIVHGVPSKERLGQIWQRVSPGTRRWNGPCPACRPIWNHSKFIDSGVVRTHI